MVKVPRFTFEKFPQADATLTTRMKSVGEAMAIGRTFKEALQKALRSLEIKRFGLLGDGADKDVDLETLRLKLAIPNAERIFYIAQAFQKGASIDEVYELTKIDRWFLRNVQQIVEEAQADCMRWSAGISALRGPAACPTRCRKQTSACRVEQVSLRLSLPMDSIRMAKSETATSQPAALANRRMPRTSSPSDWLIQFRKTFFTQWREEQRHWLKFHPKPWDWKTEREYQRRFEEDREHWLDRGHGELLTHAIPNWQK